MVIQIMKKVELVDKMKTIENETGTHKSQAEIKKELQKTRYLLPRKAELTKFAIENGLDEKEFGRLYSWRIIEDVKSTPKYAVGIINDIVFCSAARNKLKELFWKDQSHQHVNRFIEDKKARKRSNRFFIESNERNAIEKLSQVIRVAITNFEITQNYIAVCFSEEEWRELKSYLLEDDLLIIKKLCPQFIDKMIELYPKVYLEEKYIYRK